MSQASTTNSWETSGRGESSAISVIADLAASESVADSTQLLPWYVVQTKVRQEQTACENLARQGYVVYFPKIKQLKRSRGRQQAQLEPMFPCYAFLQPGSASQSISPVRSTAHIGPVFFTAFPSAECESIAIENLGDAWRWQKRSSQ